MIFSFRSTGTFLFAAIGVVIARSCTTTQSPKASELIGETLVSEHEPCVLDEILTDSEWYDKDNEVRIHFSGKDAQFWIEGHKNDPACRWQLRHVRHDAENGRCVFLCDTPAAEWFVSMPEKHPSGLSIRLTKNMQGRTLPQEYVFVASDANQAQQ